MQIWPEGWPGGVRREGTHPKTQSSVIQRLGRSPLDNGEACNRLGYEDQTIKSKKTRDQSRSVNGATDLFEKLAHNKSFISLCRVDINPTKANIGQLRIKNNKYFKFYSIFFVKFLWRGVKSAKVPQNPCFL